MPRRITATYSSRDQAETVRGRLDRIGVDPARITISDERAGPNGGGIFDKLAELIAPTAVSQPRWLLSAEVEPDQIDAATWAIEAGERWVEPEGRLEPRTFIFRETGEKLVIEKEAIVREEVVLARSADVHVEEIHDVVRRTEADVERFGPGSDDQKGSIPK